MPSLGYNALCIVINFLIFWSICLISFFVHLRNSPEYTTGSTAQVFIPLFRFLKHSRSSWGLSFHFFFHLHLFNGVLRTCSISFLQVSWRILDFVVLFLPLIFFSHFSHFQHGSHFSAKVHSYILTVYSYCLYQGLQFIFIFCKYHYVIHIHIT